MGSYQMGTVLLDQNWQEAEGLGRKETGLCVQHQEVEVEIPSGRLEIGPREEVSWRPSLAMGLLLFMETKGNDESSVSW